MDRLSILTFSSHANKRCGLRAMSEASKSGLKGIVDNLKAGGGPNIQAGLETGLQVLDGRQYTAAHAANILLMSDGQDRVWQVSNPRNVPVYTLAFGADADMKLLQGLDKNGGTFNPVPDPETGATGMLAVFSQLMAGLLTLVVQDLC